MNPADQRILVIGATGMLGQPVARRLRADGFAVRLLSRTPERARAIFGAGFDIVGGDITDPASLREAAAGCHGVHINLKGGPEPGGAERTEHQGTAAVLAAAAAAGVRHATYLSGYTVCAENATTEEIKAKLNAEAALRAGGLDYTIFRATWFMESLPLFVRGRRATLVGRQPHPLHWLAADDYAAMVSRSYRNPAARNTILYAYGPEAHTMRQALELYCRLVAPHARITTLPPWALKALGVLGRNDELRWQGEILGHYNRVGEQGSPEQANAICGAPTTTLEQWCLARAGAAAA